MTKTAPHDRPRSASRFRWGLLVLLVVLGLAARPLGLAILRWIYPYPYRDLIEREADRYDLDPLLVVSVMRVESGFSPEARSHAGARGLMQLMPTTASWAARKSGLRGFTYERMEDPETSIHLGCWYLGYLRRQFPGDLRVILAAYNAGQGNVAKWKRAPDAIEAAFPETKAYVRRGMRTYRIYRTLYREWGP